MMPGDSWAQYISVRVIVFILSWIGPLCVGYTAWNVCEAWPEWPIKSIWEGWAAIESIFFVFFLFFREHLQRAAVHPRPRSEEERRALFAKVRAEVFNPEAYFSGWFRGAKVEDIGREDVKLFLSWAFWDGTADLSPGSADEEELNEYIRKVEIMMSQPFKPGRGTATSLRLTLDPIDMECRTLLWYGLIMFADVITHILLKRNGFRYFKTNATSILVFPPRPAAIVECSKSPTEAMSYWVRPHTSKTRLPILYIHGIGIGLLPHVGFLRELHQALHLDEKSEGEVGILAIEILQVSSRLTTGILRRKDFLHQLTQVLDFHGYKRFVLASHSYGSIPSTHILMDDVLASRVAGTLFIDPVVFLVHCPQVAYNFTARRPYHANEWLLWYFASQDPGIAHTLGRHFFWSENVLWRDRVMELVKKGMRATASLASHDLIVDTQSVGMYLTEHQIPDAVLNEDVDGKQAMELQTKDTYGTANQWKQRPWRGEGLEVMWWEGLDHTEVFDTHARRAKLIDVLVQYASDDCKNGI